MLEGKYALITGATSGIGQSIALRFLNEGASVAINYRKAEKRERTEKLIRDKCPDAADRVLPVQGDVSQKADVDRMFQETLSKWPRLDILVNNAGIQAEKPSDELTQEDIDRVLDVNLRGSCLCALAAIRHFLARGGGGVVLNNTSVHEEIPKPKFLSYSMAKGALRNLTRTLALEYADRQIRVNSVGPGAILTPMNQGMIDDESTRKSVERHIPMKRIGEPDEIAAVFAFLASDQASYITGQTVMAGGGLTLYPDFQQSWSSPS